MPVIMFLKTAYKWLAELLGGLSPIFLIVIVLSGYFIKETLEEKTILEGNVATLKLALDTTVKESKEAKVRFETEKGILEKASNKKQDVVVQKCGKQRVADAIASKTRGGEKVDVKDVLGSELPTDIVSMFK